MKIAISDFDGTLKDFNMGVPRSNIEAIHKWRKAGNKFGIATGRNVTMLDFELQNYDITLDFLICVNGAVIFDKDRNILKSVKISPQIIKDFFEAPLIKDADNPMTVFCERTVFTMRRPYPDIPSELVSEISVDEAMRRDDVVQFGIKFADADAAKRAMEQIESQFPMLGGNPNRQFLDINMRGINKKTGINQLLTLMNWNDNPLFVIGDDKNDLPMITHFKGYTVKTALPSIQAAASKVYNSVGNMLLDNL